MCSARGNTALPVLGFPIRRSAGQRLFSASPRLIAAVHVLHRLLVPRHPPCALTILTVIFNGYSSEELRPVIPVYIGYCAVFKVREEQSGAAGPARFPEDALASRRMPVSQNSTACGHWSPRRRRTAMTCQIRSTC